MTQDSREQLARSQAQLVGALKGNLTVPPGFDASRVDLAATMLLRKRARSVARSWPALASSLGEQFAAKFQQYAASHLLPDSGSADDGLQFAHFLKRRGELTDAGAIEWFGLRLHRHCAAFARLRESGKRMLGVRLPWKGSRSWVVRF